jgi:hypothetical protein
MENTLRVEAIFNFQLSIINYLPIFVKIILTMETTKKSTGLYWILFFVSVAASVFVYKIGGGYCSMVLPFNLTFLTKALDLM